MKKLLTLITIFALSSCEKEDEMCDCKGLWKNWEQEVYYKKTEVICGTERPTGETETSEGYFVRCATIDY